MRRAREIAVLGSALLLSAFAPAGEVPIATDPLQGYGAQGPALPALPPEEDAEAISHRPHLSLGWGAFRYRERTFTLRPGLESEFDEPALQVNAGWEFLLGHHTIHADVDFFQTLEGREEWEEEGVPVQENDLRVWRAGFETGYLASSWDRSVPDVELEGLHRFLRLGAGVDLYYRHQHFTRDDFLLVSTPEKLDLVSNEKFDMLGAEVVLELEVGPPSIAALFVRGRGGGGYVTVSNDSLGDLEEDTRLHTAGVQGTVEGGVLSRWLEPFELRLGYRYHRMETLGDTASADRVIVELPDNTTELHLAFVEASLPF